MPKLTRPTPGELFYCPERAIRLKLDTPGLPQHRFSQSCFHVTLGECAYRLKGF